ncbi:MAG: VWA domain-containing protein [Candidatus Promineifilaceae bacterium]|nr:VWA domain-containing protein [Candidatus Promineifilaceae bacterium]
MRNADRTRLIFVAIVGVALLVLCTALVSSIWAPPTPPSATVVVQESPQIAVPDSEVVEILFWTNDTKADWVENVTERFNQEQHRLASGRVVQVRVRQGDSPDALAEMLAGALQPTAFSPGDTSWVNQANERWQDLYNRLLVRDECPRLVYTAIGLGMWRPMAEAMGWPDTPIGWQDLVDLANNPEGWAAYDHPEWGQFKFGHTNPGSSNTGLLALTSLAYAAAGVEEGLKPDLVYSDPVHDAFRELELNTYHYGTSTRSLFTAMARHGPAYLHAATNSEIGVQATNHFQRDDLWKPLVFIAPEEGVFWSDNPYCVVDADWVSDEEREAAEVYQEYLLSEEAQEIAIDEWLRPGDRSIPLRSPIDLAHGVDPAITVESVPSLPSVSGETTDAIIDLFYQTKRPATVIVLLDTSQSMEGEKLNRALRGTQRFIDFLGRNDELIVYRFGDDVVQLGPGGRVGEVGEALQLTIGNLFAEGNTALYDAVCEGMETLQHLREADEAAGEARLYGIILLSDGQDTNSERTESEMMYGCLPDAEATTGIKLFTIAYGEDADKQLLQRLANRTNAFSYPAEPETIEAIYEKIAFEQ